MRKVICKLVSDGRIGFNSVKPEVRERKKEWNKHVNEAEADSKGHIHCGLAGHVVEAGFIP